MPYRTITTEVDIDVDLGDFTHSEIADEIKYRIDRKRGKDQKALIQTFMEAITDPTDPAEKTGNLSLLDTMKMELARKIANQSTLQELELMLSKL
jgi:hypothetical protein